MVDLFLLRKLILIQFFCQVRNTYSLYSPPTKSNLLVIFDLCYLYYLCYFARLSQLKENRKPVEHWGKQRRLSMRVPRPFRSNNNAYAIWASNNVNLFTAEISTNPEYNICRAQLHHNLPDASQYHGSVRWKNQTQLRWRTRTNYLSIVWCSKNTKQRERKDIKVTF